MPSHGREPTKISDWMEPDLAGDVGGAKIADGLRASGNACFALPWKYELQKII
jgi:hypothetical protein